MKSLKKWCLIGEQLTQNTQGAKIHPRFEKGGGGPHL